ncbi:MAG: hypothetical protein NC411_07840 [Bacteroides sp.]|nr:hypothetical protein [Bacteroides sp.]
MRLNGIINRLLTFAAIALPAGAMAQTVSLLDVIQRTDLPMRSSVLQVYRSNPSMMFHYDSVSISSAMVGLDYLHESKPIMEQTGTGHTIFSIGADSYTRLGKKQAVWGDAYFKTGKYHDIRWNNCLDYDRVAPYVLGDGTGGDMNTRHYSFRGGYSALVGKWTLGIEAAYRAEIAYRDRDPRIRDIVSDLDITLGASLNVGNAYSIGIHGTFNTYNQDCDLDFYNPINDINTFTLTGLGTYYNRFMGNNNKDYAYVSTGYSGGVEIVSLNGTGLYASVGYNHYGMDERLRSFNDITLGFTDNNTLSFLAAYRVGLTDRLTLQPLAEGKIFNRKGTENLFGTSSSASYEKIGSVSPYKHDVTDLRFSLPLQMKLSRGKFLTAVPGVGYISDDESYTDPVRKLSASHIVPALMMTYSGITSGKYLIECSLDGSYAIASSKTPVLTGLDRDSALGQCVVNNFAMLQCDRLSVGAKAGLSRNVNNFVMSLSVDYGMCEYIHQGTVHGATVSLTAKF